MAEIQPKVPDRALFDYAPYRKSLAPAPFLPTTRAEMLALGWDECDIVLVTGDAYVDHPSFGMALIGRLLEAHGFRIGILAQPDWSSAESFTEFGAPKLYFGITAGNMDSMVNRYTSDKKVRNDDAYTPDAQAGARPDRAVIVYANRCREAYKDVPLVIGGIEASLRRIAHYDYWSNKVRRSILLDARADILLYGNAERALVDLSHRLAAGESVESIRDLRGTGFALKGVLPKWQEINSTDIDAGDVVMPVENPYAEAQCEALEESARSDAPEGAAASSNGPNSSANLIPLTRLRQRATRERTVIRLPSFEQVVKDKRSYAHASRVLHLESNPHNARALIQQHGDRQVWLNPPPLPLTSDEMDAIYELPYARIPHPGYGAEKIPAYQMIRFSITALRGCFGGCSFCSITEHEGRIIQNRSEQSVLREIEMVRDKTPGFTGVISDIGGPTANMYRLACKSRKIESACRKPSCVFPGVCSNLNTDHRPLIELYRKARKVSGVKKILIASGLRYDLAVHSPEYVEELATHHVGGYLKIAPEHTEPGPLAKMMKPGIGTYDRFKRMFDAATRRAGKKQYLIPYFIAAHPGTTDEDMLELACWLKRNGFKADQVQAFLPSPMATATAMYHTGLNPLRSLKRGEPVHTAKIANARALHKAFLRYHDPANGATLRSALKRMGRMDLVGTDSSCLVPFYDRPTRRVPQRGRGAQKNFATQHSGLPPRGPRGKNRSKRTSK